MNRVSVIKERLRRYISEETDTDQKLEEGSITDWVLNSDNDLEWVLSVNDDLMEALQEAMRWIGSLNDWAGAGDPDVEKWRAALAKAKGGE
jgi:hypothetical protein